MFASKALLVTSLLSFVFLIAYFLPTRSKPDAKEIWNLEERGIDCDELFQGDESSMRRAEQLQFNGSAFAQEIHGSTDKCSTLKTLFGFFDEPLSTEEAEFPLAYGMLVHDDPTQVMLLMSAVYQPQNEFCIAVDGGSSDEFYQSMRLLAECFPNVHVFKTSRISWCGFEILTSVFKCVEYLAGLQSDWKYYQYLSGVDAPLKTNLEMVRIFKALNGSFNAEVYPFEWYRLMGKRGRSSPLPLVKTSLSATFSRESTEFMVHSEVVQRQIRFLNHTLCADESLWATIAGNPKELAMPGGFDARQLWDKQMKTKKSKTARITAERTRGFEVDSYYISRYQQYVNHPPARCKGYYYRLSCVFGVRDLPRLVRRHELVAHKLYMSYQPAAFLCLIQEARRRSQNPDPSFSAHAYRNLLEAF